MLDGRVLEASQVEYKPFGKPPLQREIWVLHAKPLNPHSPPAPCYMYYMCYIILYARKSVVYV